MVMPFQSSGLSSKFKIHKKLVCAIDIHRKGMESVFIIAKYRNMEVINLNCNNISYHDKLEEILFLFQIMQYIYIEFCDRAFFFNIDFCFLLEHQSFWCKYPMFFKMFDE